MIRIQLNIFLNQNIKLLFEEIKDYVHRTYGKIGNQSG